jgi:diacylglycerol kinase (ATP)
MWQRLYKALGYSWDGLVLAYRYEPAFRQEVVLIVLLGLIAVVCNCSLTELLLFVGSGLLVLIAELFNTAIEASVDLAHCGQHKLAKLAKDTASAAVLLSLLLMLGVWGWCVGAKIFMLHNLLS